MRFLRVFLIAVIAIILVIGGIIYIDFFSIFRHSEINLQYSAAQLAFSAVSIIAIIFTLLYATYQFRKSLSEPVIALFFDENKNNKMIIDRSKDYDFRIFAFNSGSRIAVTYQIEFIIPNFFEQYLVRTREGDRLYIAPFSTHSNNSSFNISFYSYSQPENTCYVDKFVSICILRIKKIELE